MYTRIFVEKKPGFRIEALGLTNDLKAALQLSNLSEIRVLNRYDVITEESIGDLIYGIFAERNQDDVYESVPDSGYAGIFGASLLPGQYDARSDAAVQLLAVAGGIEGAQAKHMKVYLLYGSLSEEEIAAIQGYIINPVDMALTDPFGEASFESAPIEPKARIELPGLFTSDLSDFISEHSLAMSEEDLALIRGYFHSEDRNITETELYALDAYWSDHCRHSTFNTTITSVSFEGANAPVEKSLESFIAMSLEHGLKPSLMGVATAPMRYAKATGGLEGMEESDEHNACSVVISALTESGPKEVLLMFKNETHNHPTEIEPFGGASTCIGGAIRDPLSGRGYVYQSMRVSGAADILKPASQARAGKLPQRKISREAAVGFSSYGNQIGIATGHVREYYHPGFEAKRLECGAVVASALRENVARLEPAPGDLIYIVGARTGRDGIGGAQGSSKSHDRNSVVEMASEVQKGNAPIERKLQRLFSMPEASRLIKRSNDFGAGGVAVAIGEIADSIDIDLDSVLIKYEGLSATELAISESQERMAVAISPENESEFLAYVESEALEYSKTAVVTDSGRLRMFYNGQAVFDISREFLSTNGSERFSEAVLPKYNEPAASRLTGESFAGIMHALATNPNTASQQGITEMFDSSIGAGTLLAPYGGKLQKSPSDAMAHIIPNTISRASVMAHGYDPHLASSNAYDGAKNAIALSVTRAVAAGASISRCYLSLQEYFGKLASPQKWGIALSALLGAYEAQLSLGVYSIGGKDSMSGSFEDIEVPPSVISFAIADLDASEVIANTLFEPNTKVWLIKPKGISPSERGLGDLKQMLTAFHGAKPQAACAVGFGGPLEAAVKMCLGQGLGFRFEAGLNISELVQTCYGAIAASFGGDLPESLKEWAVPLGETTKEPEFALGSESVSLDAFMAPYEGYYSEVFGLHDKGISPKTQAFSSQKRYSGSGKGFGRPRAFIPVFAGTNCENDTKRAFERAGASAEAMVFRSLSAAEAQESARSFAKLINNSQILALPGGFSAADEPDGSAKYIAAFLANPYVKEAVWDLYSKREGLIIGICNGFQALIKSGLLPYADMQVAEDSPALAFNGIGRHVAKIVSTRVSSVMSPWMANVSVGETYQLPISHGEGRFVASEEHVMRMAQAGQIALQYANIYGEVAASPEANPNSSAYSIEAVSDPTGRILGKMGHIERIGEHLYKNVPGLYDLKIFEAGVSYFA
ncbi:MAG: phosphoribosylformylglycinamidine synthase [Eubacteriaceae bacterium]|nr:phosphoribosylformylglycinamidine synthase [Eubacteriaceae bacterium]